MIAEFEIHVFGRVFEWGVHYDKEDKKQEHAVEVVEMTSQIGFAPNPPTHLEEDDDEQEDLRRAGSGRSTCAP